MTIPELKKLVADSEKRMPQVHQQFKDSLKQVSDLHDAILKTDSNIRSIIADLEKLAGSADVDGCSKALDKLNAANLRKLELQNELAATLENADVIVQPIIEILNAAIAFAPVVDELSKRWLDLPAEVQNAIGKRTEGKLEWGKPWAS